MYDIALHQGFNHILDMTWSCWYPRNNKPCGRCIMCRDRKKMTENAIEHFSDSSSNYVVINPKNSNVRICLFILLFLLIIVLLNLKKY